MGHYSHIGDSVRIELNVRYLAGVAELVGVEKAHISHVRSVVSLVVCEQKGET